MKRRVCFLIHPRSQGLQRSVSREALGPTMFLIRYDNDYWEQVGNLSEHARRKSIWRHILGVFREFIWF
jgi:hypothetical protein